MNNKPLLMITALLAGACQSSGISVRVSEPLLAGIPPTNDLRRALRDLDEAKTTRDSALADLKLARLALFKAESKRELNNERLDTENAILEAANEYNSQKDVEQTKQRVESLTKLVSASNLEMDWHEADVEYAEVNLELAKARLVLAEAQLEAERAKTVQGSDKPGKEEISMLEFKNQVSKALDEVSSLEKTSGKRWEKVKELRADYDKALKEVPPAISADKQLLTKTQDENRVLVSNLDVMKKRLERLERENQELKVQAALTTTSTTAN